MPMMTTKIISSMSVKPSRVVMRARTVPFLWCSIAAQSAGKVPSSLHALSAAVSTGYRTGELVRQLRPSATNGIACTRP